MSTKIGKIAADFTTQLSAKMLVGATTGQLQSNLDDDSVELAAGVYYFTLDGNNSSKEYIQATVDGDGAMTAIKNVSRQGVLTSGTIREHRSGALVEITDFANILMLGRSFLGVDDLDATTPLEYDAAPTLTPGSNQLATVKYSDDNASAGAATASISVKGISKISVEPVSPTTPIAVGDNDPRVPTVSQVGYIPTSDEKAALAGGDDFGTPSSTNKFATQEFVGGFGDGSDGNVTISSPTTLVRDMYYNNLTVNSTLTTNGYRIFVKNTISGTGTIDWGTPNNGATATGTQTGGAGGAQSGSGHLKNSAGGAGGNGASAGSNGSNGTAATNGNPAVGAAGGAGGNGGNAQGGGNSGAEGDGAVGGTITAPARTFGVVKARTVDLIDLTAAGAVAAIVGSTGGGGGGGGASGTGSVSGGGGGGGASGGTVLIVARVWAGTFTIKATGGNGGGGSSQVSGSAAAVGGGGGGGAGGTSIVIYNKKSWTGSYNLAGGTGGAKGATGVDNYSVAANGSSGTTGVSYEFQSFNLI